MINQSLISTDSLTKENLRYSPSSSVIPVVKHVSYSRHLSSRYQTRFLNRKPRKIIHVTIQPSKHNSHQSKENKSQNSITNLHSMSSIESQNDCQNKENLFNITLNSARQVQSATNSLCIDTNLRNHRLFSESSHQSYPQNQDNHLLKSKDTIDNGLVLQRNHFSSKTNRTNFSFFENNDGITQKEDWISNTQDLVTYSGEKKKKKCSDFVNCRCSCALILLLTTLLVGLAIMAILLATLIKPDTTTTSGTSELTTITSTIVTTTTITTTSTTVTSTTTTITSTSTTYTTTTTSRTTSTTLLITTTVNTTASTSAYFGQESIIVNCSTTLTNITIQIFLQKTVGATYASAYGTFWGGTTTQSYTTNSTYIIYTWTIANGQTIACSGGPYSVVAQFSLTGTAQITSADTYIVTTKTSAGVTTTLSGHF